MNALNIRKSSSLGRGVVSGGGGGGGGATPPSFGRFVGKTRVKQKKLLKEHVRSVNLLKIVGKLTNKMLFVGKTCNLHVNTPPEVVASLRHCHWERAVSYARGCFILV